MDKQEDLIAAIQSGDASRVGRLLDEDRSLLSARSGNASALLLAVYHGKPEIARLFVERGARLSFHEACALGELDEVKAMLAADSSLLQRYSDDGYAPLGFATFFGHPEVDVFLIEQGGDVNAAATNAQKVAPLHAAAAVGNRDMLRRLLERGADPNARQQLDFTPLHSAATHGDIEMAKILLDHGADRNARSSDGKTPADVARERGHRQFAEWITG